MIEASGEPVVSETVEITDRTVVLFRLADDDQPNNQTLTDFGKWCCQTGVNPLCIVVRGDDMGMEFLDVEAMNAAGWYRKDDA